MRFLVETLRTTRSIVGEEVPVGAPVQLRRDAPGRYHAGRFGRYGVQAHLEGLIEFLDLDVGVEPQQVPFIFPTHHSGALSNRGFVEGIAPVALGKVVVMADRAACCPRFAG